MSKARIKLMEKSIIFPALIISFCIYLGMALWRFGSLDALVHEGVFSFLCIFVFIVAFAILFMGIRYLYHRLDEASNKNSNTIIIHPTLNRFEKYYASHPYLSVYILFIIIYLPYLILAYPSVLWGDAPSQILQAYNLPNKTMYWLKMMNENVYLNQHHSVPHTMLIHVCLVAGKALCNSYNLGLFFYSLIQFLFIVFCFAYSTHFLYSYGVKKKYLLLLLCYCLISPRLYGHILLLTKDIIYGGFFLLFSISLFGVLTNKTGDSSKIQLIMLLSSAIGLFLFRNEGIIVDIVILLLAVVFNAQVRKYLAGVLATCFIVFFMLSKVIYPAFDISPGSIREVLCIPFQQTSLYLNRHLDEVTPQEKDAISEILDFDHIRTTYEWDRADRAKESFNNDYTKEQLRNYFYVWWQMFLKHPMTYFDATLHQTYKYFFPIEGLAYGGSFEDSEGLMRYTNDNSGNYHMDYHYPIQLSEVRNLFEKGLEFLARYTPLAVFSYSATYLWSLVVAFFYFVRCKKRNATIALVASILQFAACFAGPLDGSCFRYLYPMALALPFIILAGIFIE